MNNNATRMLSHAEKAFMQKRMENLYQRIAVRAYFKAEQRGFAPGHALDDWLEAEAEIFAEDAASHLQPEE